MTTVSKSDLRAHGGRMGWEIKLEISCEGDDPGATYTHITARRDIVRKCIVVYRDTVKYWADRTGIASRDRRSMFYEFDFAIMQLQHWDYKTKIAAASSYSPTGPPFFELSVSRVPLQRVMIWRPFPIEGVVNPNEYVPEGSDDETIVVIQRQTRRHNVIVESDSGSDYSDDQENADASAFDGFEDDGGVSESIGDSDTESSYYEYEDE